MMTITQLLNTLQQHNATIQLSYAKGMYQCHVIREKNQHVRTVHQRLDKAVETALSVITTKAPVVLTP